MSEKHYKLWFLPLFEDDLNDIVDYIILRLKNPVAAAQFVDDVQAAISDKGTVLLSGIHTRLSSQVTKGPSLCHLCQAFTPVPIRL